ncbi:hypothetical protein [Streptosporangium saharense]|uniref:hypothetical protein n=1 Tax=Streptosporangium saharense TaxID=1706840 RepID=UPI00344910AE
MSGFDRATWQRLCGPYDPRHRFKIPVPDDLTKVPGVRDCRHCGKLVVPFNSAFGRLWVGVRAVASCPESPDGGHRPEPD